MFVGADKAYKDDIKRDVHPCRQKWYAFTLPHVSQYKSSEIRNITTANFFKAGRSYSYNIRIIIICVNNGSLH